MKNYPFKISIAMAFLMIVSFVNLSVHPTNESGVLALIFSLLFIGFSMLSIYVDKKLDKANQVYKYR